MLTEVFFEQLVLIKPFVLHRAVEDAQKVNNFILLKKFSVFIHVVDIYKNQAAGINNGAGNLAKYLTLSGPCLLIPDFFGSILGFVREPNLLLFLSLVILFQLCRLCDFPDSLGRFSGSCDLNTTSTSSSRKFIVLCNIDRHSLFVFSRALLTRVTLFK